MLHMLGVSYCLAVCRRYGQGAEAATLQESSVNWLKINIWAVAVLAVALLVFLLLQRRSRRFYRTAVKTEGVVTDVMVIPGRYSYWVETTVQYRIDGILYEKTLREFYDGAGGLPYTRKPGDKLALH